MNLASWRFLISLRIRKISVANGRIKRAEHNWNKVQKTFISSLLLLIFQQLWTKLLNSIQEGYKPSPLACCEK